MTAFDEYMQLLKTAASGERPHNMLPGRTTKSMRDPQGPMSPPTFNETEYVTEPEEVKAPKVNVVTPDPAKSPEAPKVDISFSVKVGSQQTAPDPRNTGAHVNSAFMPAGQVGGSYGNTTLAEEESLMQTPALPSGTDGTIGPVGNIRVANLLAGEMGRQALAKAAVTKPSAPVPPGQYSEEQQLQKLLQDMRREGLIAGMPMKVGSLELVRKLAKLGAEPVKDSVSSESPETALQADQRKQDLHEQQLQFNEDKHELEMEKLRQQLLQAQEKHMVERQLDQEKILSQQSEQPQAPMEMNPQQQQMQYQQNIMSKAAAMYTDGLEPVNTSSPIPALALGAGLGGAAANYIAPTAEAQKYRNLANSIAPERAQEYFDAMKRHKGNLPKNVRDRVMDSVSDVTQAGNRVKFRAPAHVRKRYFLDRALQSNSKRLVHGAGLGLLAGLAAYSGMKE